jgi:hypothetical protein
VTTCNRSLSVKRHAELQCSHEPRNSNCNTGYTNTQPSRGAIAWWSDAAAPHSGHVAYVDAVKKNKAGQVIGVYIEQYNWEFAPGYTPGKYSHVYIPKGGKYQGEPYPTDFEAYAKPGLLQLIPPIFEI